MKPQHLNRPRESALLVAVALGLPTPLQGVWIQPNIEFGGGYRTAILVRAEKGP